MFRAIVLVALVAVAVPGLAAKTALDLMLEGRYTEAKAVLDATGASPRYQILYYALTEADAARACSLYQVVVIRYPGSECDSVARGRLDQAHGMGMVIVPLAEWSQAPDAVKPLPMWERPPVATAPKPIPPATVTPQTSVTDVSVPAVPEPKPPVVAAPEKAVTDVIVPVTPEPKPPVVAAPEKAVTDVIVPVTPEPKPPVVAAPEKAVTDVVVPVSPEPKPPVATAPVKAVTDVIVPVTPEPKPPVAAAPEKAVTDVVVPVSPEAKPPVAVAAPKAVMDVVVAPAPETAPPKEKTPPPVAVSSPAPIAEPKVEPVKEPVSPTKPVHVEPAPAVKDVVRDTATVTRVTEKPQKEIIATTRAPELAAPVANKPAIEVKEKSQPPAPPPQTQRVEPRPPSAAPHDRPVPNGHWFIQVGAFGNSDNAHRLALQLEKAGFPVKLVPRETSKGTLLQVRVGGYKSRDECSPIVDQLKEKFDVPTVVISE